MQAGHILGFIWCMCVCVCPLFAQNSDTLPQFNLIRTPVSPAFTLLGVAPTDVERPNTPADIAISILSKTTSFTQFPSEFAMEFSPYWLTNHPKLTWEDDTTRNFWESFERTATLSIGTASISDSLNPATGLALGFRTSLFSGKTSDNSIKTLQKITNQLTANSTAFLELTQAARKVADSVFKAKGGATNPEALKEFTATIKKINETTFELFTPSAIDDFTMDREGFLLELALGGVWHFPNNIADSGKFASLGVWVTPAYQWTNWSIVGVGRLLSNKVGDSTQTTIDVGLRLIYTANKYGISFEAVDRTFTWANAPKNEWRIAAVFDYEISDGSWITATFGRDYRSRSQGRNLLAKLGITISTSSQRYPQLPK